MDSSALPSEIQALLRYAFRVKARVSFTNALLHPTNNAAFEDPEQDNPRFGPVVDGIHFSLRFILSYQLVLIGLLLLFTAVHWGGRWRAWRRRRNLALERRHEETQSPIRESKDGRGGIGVENRSSGSSSSSSTLGRDVTPKDLDIRKQDEQTPLLLKSRPVRIFSRPWQFVSKTKACLTYQPRPIPVINKTLPSNGTTLAVLAFLGLQIFYAFYNIHFTLKMIFVFADRTALVFVANLPLLYLFAAKNQPIKLLTGYSYESLNIFHRRLGEVMCLLALLHSAGMIGVWYTILRPVGITLVKFLLIKMILLGIGALVAYELIYLTSLGSFRQRWYELFLGLHIVLQAAALVLVWFHHRRSRWYVGIALAIFLIDRLVYRMTLKSTTLRALLAVKEDKQTVVLRTAIGADRLQGLASRVFGSNITKGWKPTEHVFLAVPSLAIKHIIQAHPFTIASKAPTEGEDTQLELLVRAQDGFSGDLVRHAHDHYTVSIRLDGPYGSQSAVQMLQGSDHAVIVAGGSGVAVAWPLLWAVLNDLGNRDLESSLTEAKTKQILFIWIIREKSHLSWLGAEKIKELEARGVRVEIPPPTSGAGHPDIKSTINDWVVSVDDRTRAGSKLGVVGSGPDGMNRTVRNTCASLIWQGRDVSVEIEKFGW